MYLHNISDEVPCVNAWRTTHVGSVDSLCVEKNRIHTRDRERTYMPVPVMRQKKEQCEYAINSIEREHISIGVLNDGFTAFIIYHRCGRSPNVSHFQRIANKIKHLCVVWDVIVPEGGGGSFTFPAFRIQLKCLPIQLIVDGHLNNRQEFKLHSQFKSKTAVSYQILQIDV